MSNHFFTANLMLLSDRSFSRDFTQKCQLENEHIILGMKLSINPPNVTIGNRDNVSNESKCSNRLTMLSSMSSVQLTLDEIIKDDLNVDSEV